MISGTEFQLQFAIIRKRKGIFESYFVFSFTEFNFLHLWVQFRKRKQYNFRNQTTILQKCREFKFSKRENKITFRNPTTTQNVQRILLMAIFYYCQIAMQLGRLQFILFFSYVYSKIYSYENSTSTRLQSSFHHLLKNDC